MTLWEVLVHLDNSGWIHRKLRRRAPKSEKKEVVPIDREGENRTWWTRAGMLPNHKYLLVLARATEILVAVPVPSIEHFQQVAYYQSLLEGKIPTKGEH